MRSAGLSKCGLFNSQRNGLASTKIVILICNVEVMCLTCKTSWLSVSSRCHEVDTKINEPHSYPLGMYINNTKANICY
jgi:hypothetical protein